MGARQLHGLGGEKAGRADVPREIGQVPQQPRARRNGFTIAEAAPHGGELRRSAGAELEARERRCRRAPRGLQIIDPVERHSEYLGRRARQRVFIQATIGRPLDRQYGAADAGARQGHRRGSERALPGPALVLARRAQPGQQHALAPQARQICEEQRITGVAGEVPALQELAQPPACRAVEDPRFVREYPGLVDPDHQAIGALLDRLAGVR